ncbi:MAG: primosomal protein N' [Balneolaceae bacterium]|nr:MAG: primosomal protein N' [Balneolaceae bacterium]
MYADIALPTPVRQVFTYLVPNGLRDSLAPGMRVWIPLRDQMAIGMVTECHNRKPAFEVREIVRSLDSLPVMPPELIDLTRWISQFYYCSHGEAVQASLPAGLNFVAEVYLKLAGHDGDAPPEGLKGDNNFSKEELDILGEVQTRGRYHHKEALKRWGDGGERIIKSLVRRGILQQWQEPELRVKRKMVTVFDRPEDFDIRLQSAEEALDGRKKPVWFQALEAIAALDLPMQAGDIREAAGCSDYAFNRLRKEGWFTEAEVPAPEEVPDLEYDPAQIALLNNSQQEAFEAIRGYLDAGEYHHFLMHGVTGSGKTEVYIHALRHVLEAGRTGLVLVPEIALTPQTLRRFYRIFGNSIALLHSRLNDRERYEAWKQLRDGKKRIAIGPRSAVFAPLENLGLIIIDEEHDSSYKQEDPAPRYHARDVAIMRAFRSDAVIVTGSATPSLVSLYNSSKGKNTLIKLRERHSGHGMPAVNIIDLKKYRSSGMHGPLAAPLYQAMADALDRDEQVILLYNRRGYAGFVQCETCGHIEECPSCSVALTFHKYRNHVRCHYCGYSRNLGQNCSSCDAGSVKQVGSGTQRVEEELDGLFPGSSILRMDQDTTGGKDSHARILNSFGRGEHQILVGTQLVAKGLDFPNVTVVGVVNADTELAFPSYRSSERMFQLLSQVSGRPGRAAKAGVVYLQTWQPEHPSIVYARNHDFEGFAAAELSQRKNLLWPPYSRLVQFTFKSADAQLVGRVAQVFVQALIRVAGGIPVLGPAPAAIHRIKNEFRWEGLMKMPVALGAASIEQLLDQAFAAYETGKPKGASKVRITVNVDAV